MIFLFYFAQNIHFWAHVRTASPSNEYHQSMFWSKNKKIIKNLPLHTLILLYKTGNQWGIHYTDMFYDVDLSVGFREIVFK